jgi:hypothetical protein
MTANNRLVAEWSDALHRHPLPPSTDLLGTRREFGLLEGNGNHCDIRLTLDVITSLSAAEVRQHYAASGLAERLGPPRRDRPSWRAWTRLEPWSDGRPVVRVELFSHGGNLGDNGGFDPRCH